MPARRKNKPASLAAKAAETAWAVPQVVAHRVTRMALAGPAMSQRDRKEFKRMADEKAAAFTESWSAMSAHAVQAHQALAVALVRSFWSPTLKGRPTPLSVAAQLHGATLGLLNKGLGPVHRKAVANAKRLARTRLR